ncbi:S9 family peptidase [Nakamurella lactea]|uniref:S9 family peptidase n=1 Tax=Nakamurella lactea TaxID=459515 RepID=UPI000426ACA1|nr:S9 family peptidase [Nakamurella lactea]
MTRLPNLDDLEVLQRPSDPTISPDGGTVVYVVTTVDTTADADRSRLWCVSTGGSARELTSGDHDAAPRFSPDGSRIAFLRVVDGAPQLHLLDMTGPGEPTKLGAAPLGAGAPVWSPDGRRIAFTAPVDRAAPEAEDAAAGAARRSTAPVAIDRLGYKADGSGRLGELRSQLFVAAADTDAAAGTAGGARQLTDVDGHLGAPSWHPDGDRIVVTGSLGDDADLGYVSTAFQVAVPGSAELENHSPATDLDPIGVEDGMIALAGWLPDGTDLLAVGRAEPSVGHLHLLRMAPDGKLKSLTDGLDRNVMPGGPGYPGGLPQPIPGGDEVLFCARDRGCTGVYRVGMDGATPTPVLATATSVVSGLSVAAAAPVAAAVVADGDSYGEIVLVDLTDGSRATLTAHTHSWPADVRPARVVERTFTLDDGGTVHGFLLRPENADGATPLLLDAHGGPHNAWSPVPDAGHGYHQLLVDKGWSVLLLNPRASDGYGEDFYLSNVGAWGHGDQADFLEPLQQLVNEGLADPGRLAVTGYSYGGFTTCWLTGHTDVFAAAVAGGVVSDTVGLLTSDEGYPGLSWELGGTAWADREKLAGQSPFESVAAVNTPTLILHGGSDDRCPVGQAELWFTALRSRGVPTRLVLYPGGSHLFILNGRPSHRRDYSERLTAWVTDHAGGAAASTTTTEKESA